MIHCTIPLMVLPKIWADTPIKYLMTFHIKTIQHNTMPDQTICMLPRSGVDRHTVQCDVTYDRPAEPSTIITERPWLLLLLL